MIMGSRLLAKASERVRKYVCVVPSLSWCKSLSVVLVPVVVVVVCLVAVRLRAAP